MMDSLRELRQALNDLSGLNDDQRDAVLEQCKLVARDATAILYNHKSERDAWSKERDDLKRQIEEQGLIIDNKRALWMSNNPGDSAQRRNIVDAISQDHALETPSSSRNSRRTTTQPPSRTPTSMSSYAENSSFIKDFGAPPRIGNMPLDTASPAKNRHRNMGSGLPTHTAPSSHQKHSQSPYLQRPTTGAEVGSPSRSPSRIKLNLHHQPDPLAHGADIEAVLTLYRKPLAKLFGMAEGWARAYADIPSPLHDDLIAGRFQKQWRFMLSCLSYSNEDNATSHANTLLRDPQSRYFFAMRMVIQYCEREIIGVKTFKNYDANVKSLLDDIDRRSEERGMCFINISFVYDMLITSIGLPTEARQVLVDERTAIINRVMQSKDYPGFRQSRLDYYARELSYLTWPILKLTIDSTRCGKDMAAIVQLAWEIAEEQLTSGFTFQTTFPEENSKFSEASMSAKDHPHDNPKKLQIEQWRIKLTITPVITLRSDRGAAIIAKNLFNAIVLLMR